MRCELCHRAVPHLTRHHLTPRSQLKRSPLKKGETPPTICICPACHRQLHVLFSNRELAQEFNTPEKLRAAPPMQRFLRWAGKQDAGKCIRVRR